MPSGNAYAKPNTYCHIHAYSDGYSHLYAYVYSDVYAYAYGHSNVHAYSNSECYSGNSDSDAHMRAGCDLIRHFEWFWYRGG